MRSPLPSIATIERGIRRSWPRSSIRKMRVDQSGWTNLMIEADGRWMIRIPRWPSSARSLGYEVRLLEFLADRTTIRLPAPEIIGTLPEPAGWPYLVYPKLPGTPLRGLRQLARRDRMRLGGFLMHLFSDLDRIPMGPLLKIGAGRGDPASFAGRFEALRRKYQRLGAGHLTEPLGRRVTATLAMIRATLADSRYRPVLIHNDLWPSHILWNRQSHRATAVIDWEDARLGDPAADLTTFAELGPRILSNVGEHRRQRSDHLFWERRSLYQEILPLWGYLFGLETKNRGIANTHLEQLRKSLLSPRARAGVAQRPAGRS